MSKEFSPDKGWTKKDIHKLGLSLPKRAQIAGYEPGLYQGLSHLSYQTPRQGFLQNGMKQKLFRGLEKADMEFLLQERG